MSPATVVMLIVTSCQDAGMSVGCDVVVKPQPRQYTCEWNRVTEINQSAKRGRYADGQCQPAIEGVAKK